MNDEDLTVVIITYNRYNHLSRLLRFYERLSVKFKFLVLDSSDIEVKSLKEVLGSTLDIKYEKFDSKIFFVKKIAQGVVKIHTRYAVLAADDDFLMPTGLRESMRFLHSYPDYSSAHGRYFQHYLKVDRNGSSNVKVFPLYNQGTSSESSNPLVRLEDYLSGRSIYYPFYAVHRTAEFCSLWRSTNNYVSDWGLSEVYPCALSLIYGKSRVLDVFYASREPNGYVWYDDKRHTEMYTDPKLRAATLGLLREVRILRVPEFERAGDMILGLFKGYVARSVTRNTNGVATERSLLERVIRRIDQVFFRMKVLCFGSRSVLSRGGVNEAFLETAFAELLQVADSVSSSNVGAELVDSRARYASQLG